jgi:lysozyme
MSHLDIVRAQLRIDEDSRPFPYKDSEGILTIGIGRNLEHVGLRPDEIVYLLDNDIKVAEATARVLFENFDGLSENRRAVLVNMAFNLGQTRLSAFKDFRAAINARNFEQAAEEMLDSKWAKQVGVRALRLAKQMREG